MGCCSFKSYIYIKKCFILQNKISFINPKNVFQIFKKRLLSNANVLAFDHYFYWELDFFMVWLAHNQKQTVLKIYKIIFLRLNSLIPNVLICYFQCHQSEPKTVVMKRIHFGLPRTQPNSTSVVNISPCARVAQYQVSSIVRAVSG